MGLENAHVCILSMMQPRRFSSPAVDKQLIYAFWDRYGFYQMGEMLKEIFPRHADKMAQVENYGEDHTVADTAVGKELLSRLSRNGEWRKLKESLADNAKSWL